MAGFVGGIRTLLHNIRNTIRRLLINEDGHAHRTGVPLMMEALAPRTSAEARARQLLVRVLSPAQREDFERLGYFTVQVAGWGDFRILPRTVFNVMDTVSGTYYCAGPEGSVPLSDLMLAQKLVLESDPECFFRVARRRREDE